MQQENILDKCNLQNENIRSSSENSVWKFTDRPIYNIIVAIPALNPIESLVSFVEELLDNGVSHVIVVNDGSDSSFDPIFEKINTIEHCKLLVHEKNYGKGRALKTAFTYILKNHQDTDGVVTADADGQHTVEDICKVCRVLSFNKESLVLGMRTFSEDNVPYRSYIGNKITSVLFRLLYGSYLEDTQTGLRGIPVNKLDWITQIKGERYEYEINMLIQAKLNGLEFACVPIRTLYFNHNKGTHFNTIKDASIVFTYLVSGIFKFSLSALFSGILDVAIFFMLNSILLASYPASLRLAISSVIARIFSSCFNFTINQKIFKASGNKLSRMVVKYYTLWLFQLIASYEILYITSLSVQIHDSILKILIDIVLGIVGYQVQLRWVFKNKDLTMSNNLK